jgi:hypothetical protein
MSALPPKTSPPCPTSRCRRRSAFRTQSAILAAPRRRGQRDGSSARDRRAQLIPKLERLGVSIRRPESGQKADRLGMSAKCHKPTSLPTSSARPSSVIGKISFPLLVDYGCAARRRPDIHACVASTASVVNDPTRTSKPAQLLSSSRNTGGANSSPLGQISKRVDCGMICGAHPVWVAKSPNLHTSRRRRVPP